MATTESFKGAQAEGEREQPVLGGEHELLKGTRFITTARLV